MIRKGSLVRVNVETAPTFLHGLKHLHWKVQGIVTRGKAKMARVADVLLPVDALTMAKNK